MTGLRFISRTGLALEPFLHAQYTVINGWGNSYTMTAGVSYRLHKG